MKFYRGLFSHKDRPSQTKHDLIDSKVSDHQEHIKTNIYDFKVYELENCIKSLKINKSPGHYSFSNEFFKFGVGGLLSDTLLRLFNGMVDFRPISISICLASIL